MLHHLDEPEAVGSQGTHDRRDLVDERAARDEVPPGLDGPLAILSPLVAREGRKEEDAELGRLKTLLER